MTGDDDRAAAFEARCLAVEPFNDRDDDSVTLRDGFVTTRRDHLCVICRDEILAGRRVRSMTQRSRDLNAVHTFWFCEECCDALAASRDDGGDKWTARLDRAIRRPHAARADA